MKFITFALPLRLGGVWLSARQQLYIWRHVFRTLTLLPWPKAHAPGNGGGGGATNCRGGGCEGTGEAGPRNGGGGENDDSAHEDWLFWALGAGGCWSSSSLSRVKSTTTGTRALEAGGVEGTLPLFPILPWFQREQKKILCRYAYFPRGVMIAWSLELRIVTQETPIRVFYLSGSPWKHSMNHLD